MLGVRGLPKLPSLNGCRHFSSDVFTVARPGMRQRHTHKRLPIHDANNLGGRTAYLRHTGWNKRFTGRLWKKDFPTVKFNVDVWCAQQTLRKKWKARDWEIVELPFERAPEELQGITPELYSDVPSVAMNSSGRTANVRDHVYACEDLQGTLFSGGGAFQGNTKKVKDSPTLDTFL